MDKDQTNIQFLLNMSYFFKTMRLIMIIFNVSYFIGLIWLVFCDVVEYFRTINRMDPVSGTN